MADPFRHRNPQEAGSGTPSPIRSAGGVLEDMTTLNESPGRRNLIPGMAVLGAFLLMAACEAPEYEEELPPPAQPTMGVAEATVTLEPVDDSGVSGQATVMHTEDELVVVLELEGLPEAGEFAAHIHAGSCAEGGPVAVPLNDVIADEEGFGTSTTALDADAIDHDGEYFFQVHSADGPPIACGDLEMDDSMDHGDNSAY